MLAKSTLNNIETLIYQALIDYQTSHEKLITTVKEKQKHKKMNGNLRNINEKFRKKTENMRINSVNSRT